MPEEEENVIWLLDDDEEEEEQRPKDKGAEAEVICIDIEEEEEESSPSTTPFSSSLKDIGAVPARAAYSDCTSFPTRCDCTETPFPMFRLFLCFSVSCESDLCFFT